MKRFFMYLCTISVIGFSACNNNSTVNKKEEDANARSKDADTSAVYTCTMDPEVTSDKPGTCPICGMDLVKK